MKKIFLFTFCIAVTAGAAAAPKDSTDIDSLKKAVQELQHSLNTLSREKNNSVFDKNAKAPATAIADCCEEDIAIWKVVLIYSPLIFFVILFIYFQRKFRREGYKLSDALSTYRPETTSTSQVQFGAEGIQTNKVTQQNTQDIVVRSASRTIAFFTAMCSIIIAIVLTSYTGYHAITGCGENVSVDGLWKILLALGIGVIPYGANVFNGNGKENSNTPLAK